MTSPTAGGRPVRVRVAPSPTGDPHVGTAYMALFNYVFAKAEGGRFILRIEDTDRARSRPDSEQAIFDALRWIGLSWDEGPDVGGDYGPYRQSERFEIYARYTSELLASKKAYRCFCTSERLAELKDQQKAAKQNQGYDRRCRDIGADEAARRAADGEAHVVRLAVPDDETIEVHGLLREEPTRIASSQIDDQVLLKSDGFPTYHLANVVDDHLMEITHVIRAEEWISSTPKHILLYRAFGWEPPVWVHMPLLRNDKGGKISKRKNPVSLNYYRDIGVLPEALLNFLGIMGWSFGNDREVFTLDEMIEVFSWDKVSLGGPVFNFDKLRWMNERYIHQLSDEQLADRLVDWRLHRDYFRLIAPLFRERVKLLSDLVPSASYLFAGDLEYGLVADKLALADVTPKVLKNALLELVERYDELVEFSAANLEETTRRAADDQGFKTGKFFMVLRVAITGQSASPPLFETMVALGKELTRHRIRDIANQLAALAQQASKKS